MVTTEEFQKAVDLIRQSTNVLLTTHTRPDGDACGCIVALCETLETLGKSTQVVFLSEIPEWYEFLFEKEPPVLGQDIDLEQLEQSRFDLVVVVDTNSYSQLPGLEELLRKNHKPVFVVDHHVTSDGLGDVELIDTSAAGAGLIVYDLFQYANWQITPKVAQALFVAVATDTGWFRFSNTDGRTHRVCAELIEAGADPAQIYHRLYQNFSYSRIKLLAAMLASLELHLDGRYASQQLLKSDFERTGATYRDTENLIDECRRISTVEAAALFVELADGGVRCSLRSAGRIDVRQIAQKFGGGGHKMAAGATLDGPVDRAKQVILAEMKRRFAE